MTDGRGWHRFAVFGAALALGATAMTAQAQDKVSKIGVLAPLTGGAAADGQEMVRGVQLAVDEINAKGGVAGYKFEVVEGDVREQSSDAVISAFERLSGDSALNLMTTGYASTTNFEIEYMAEADMPYLIAANSAQTREIVSKAPDKFPTVWSLTPSFDAYETELVPVVEGLAASGKLKLPNKKVALISSDNPYSKTIYEGLIRSFEKAGWTVTVDELVPFGEINDWRSMLAKVRQDPPAVVINTDYLPANAATFMQQFMEKPTDSLVFIQYAPSVPEFVKLTKEKSTGVVYNLLGGALTTPKNPRAAEIANKYKEKFGVESGPYGIGMYEMMMIYFDAVEKVGDPSKRLEIGKAIGETDKRTAQGRIVFDPKTHLSRQGNDYVPIQFYQIWEGERVLFYPEQYATGEFRSPPWKN
ncbi:MAG: ABC transporter substrate-binding protein [Alphaproteobacteria bacterium]